MDLTHLLVLIIMAAMLGAMVLEVAHPSKIAFITLILFFILGYTSPSDMMVVVSNEGVLTLVLLFIIATVIERTNIIERILYRVLKKSKSGNSALLRLMSPLMGFSAFFNNTPIVVMMVPAIQKWCSERRIHASKFLLPISYATIFGGMFTIIGTSTNLIVHGWLLDKGLEGFSFFQLAPYIIVGVITGIIYLYFIGYKLLPENVTAIDNRYDEGKEFLYEAVVNKDCKLIGKTVTSTDIKRLKGLYLIKIIREEETISPVRLEDVIHENDLLVFTGTLDSLKTLETIKNLSIKTDSHLSVESLETGETKLIEGVISHHSSLVHHKIKHTNFRSKFNASIVAVHRKHERIEENVGDIKLKPGDVLLLLAGKDFEEKAYNNNDFYVLSDIPKRKFFNKKQTSVSIIGFLSMILLVAFGVLTMFEAALLCIGLYLVFDLFDPEQVKTNIPFQVLLLIVSSLGIGSVIEATGTAELLANAIIHLVAENLGIIGLLFIIYLITNMLTEVITNAAAAIIVLPISFEVATYVDFSPVLISVVVAIAASASFSTPIGYQTNLIVYGPGGYKFKDYLKVGLPLNLIFMVTTVFSVYFLS